MYDYYGKNIEPGMAGNYQLQNLPNLNPQQDEGEGEGKVTNFLQDHLPGAGIAAASGIFYGDRLVNEAAQIKYYEEVEKKIMDYRRSLGAEEYFNKLHAKNRFGFNPHSRAELKHAKRIVDFNRKKTMAMADQLLQKDVVSQAAKKIKSQYSWLKKYALPASLGVGVYALLHKLSDYIPDQDDDNQVLVNES